MKRLLLIIPFLFLTTCLLGQESERVKVQGKIVVKNNDVEGVTVYNTSSQKGTITDFDGKFIIDVKPNDRVKVSALQFKKFTVVIDQGIVDQKRMTIFLVEEVNKLPEIVVTPYDLSGNIAVDAERVRTLNLPFEMEIGNAPIDLTDDYKTRAENPFVMGASRNPEGLNVKNLIVTLLKPLFKKKNNKNKLEEYRERVQDETQNQAVMDLRMMYTNAYMKSILGIPEDKVNEFIVFVEDQGLDYSLLNEGKEMEFIDFLVQQSQSFLKMQSEKD